MNIESDQDRTKSGRIHSVAPYEAGDGANTQVKYVFAAVTIVTLVWLGIILYLGRELFARAFT